MFETEDMMWIFAFWFMNIITMIIGEHEGPECRQLDNNERFFPANFTNNWLNNIDMTLMFALRQNRNFEHIISNLNKPFHSIATHCSYKRWVQWDDNRLRPLDQTLCGIRMINKYYYNLKTNVQEMMLINVAMHFALNVTFMYFKTDEYHDDSCLYISVKTLFVYGNGTCNTKPKQGVCGYRHPWSVIIPSFRVVIYVESARLINPVKFHVAYQVVEKCRQQMALKDSHIIHSQKLSREYVTDQSAIYNCWFIIVIQFIFNTNTHYQNIMKYNQGWGKIGFK